MSLTTTGKDICVIWDFPSLTTRFVTRDHSGLTLTGGWTQFEGAIPKKDGGTEFDVHENRINVGDASFSITDVGELVSAWLATNDASLAQTPVTRKQGLVGDSEAGYTSSSWVLEDYGVDKEGGYIITLVSVLKAMSRGLYEEFSGESASIQNDPLSATGNAITLDDNSDTSNWREPGYALITNKDTGIQELISYTSITGTSMTGVLRARYGVGGDPSLGTYGTGREHPKDSEIAHVWVKRGNPINVMLELLTTTVAGGNGSYDQADGDGLGIDDDFIDVTGIEAVRTEYWPVPSFDTDGSLLSGTAVLFVETDAINDVKEFIEDHILRPFALKPKVTGANKFSIETYYRVPPPETVVGKKWVSKSIRPGRWVRNLPNAVNVLRGLCDHNISNGKLQRVVPVEQGTSQTRYMKSKSQDIKSKGGRNGLFGFPDYSSDEDLATACAKILLEVANPWSQIDVDLFYEFRDIALGDVISIDLPVLLNVAQGVRGFTNALFFVDQREVDDSKGTVGVVLRLRRPIGRPAFVAPNSVSSSYNTASDSDKNYAYVCDDGGEFDDGEPAYTVI